MYQLDGGATSFVWYASFNSTGSLITTIETEQKRGLWSADERVLVTVVSNTQYLQVVAIGPNGATEQIFTYSSGDVVVPYFGTTLAMSYPRLAVSNSSQQEPAIVIFDATPLANVSGSTPGVNVTFKWSETITEPFLHYISDHEYAESMSFSAGGKLLTVGVPGDEERGSVYLYAWATATDGKRQPRQRADPPMP